MKVVKDHFVMTLTVMHVVRTAYPCTQTRNKHKKGDCLKDFCWHHINHFRFSKKHKSARGNLLVRLHVQKCVMILLSELIKPYLKRKKLNKSHQNYEREKYSLYKSKTLSPF